MTLTAEQSRGELVQREQPRIVASTPEGELQGLEWGLHHSLVGFYNSIDFGTSSDYLYKDAANRFILDHPDVRDVLGHVVQRYGYKTTDREEFTEVAEKIFERFKAAAFADAYVDQLVEAILDGDEDNYDKHSGRSETLRMLKSDLYTPVEHNKKTYMGPAHYYGELSHTVWTGYLTAVREGDYDKAKKIHDVHKAIKPGVDHESMRAISLVAELAYKIEEGQKFSNNKLRTLGRHINTEVAPEVRRQSHEIDKIFEQVTCFVAERKLYHQSIDSDESRKRADLYGAILEEMHAEVFLVADLIEADTPAAAFGPDVVDDIRRQYVYPDSEAPSVTVDKDDADRVKSVKVLFTRSAIAKTTGIATVVAAAAVLGSHFAVIDNQTANEAGIKTFVVPNIADDNPESGSDQTGSSVDTPNGISLVAEEGVNIERTKPEPREKSGDKPTAEEVSAVGSLPVVGIDKTSEGQLVEPKNASENRLRESLDNYHYSGTFEQAVNAWTSGNLKKDPNAAPSADAAFTENALKQIEFFRSEIIKMNKDGTLDKELYLRADDLLLKAAVASQYPSLSDELGITALGSSPYIDLLTKKWLLTTGVLGVSADAQMTNDVALAIANAFAVITPEADQAAFIAQNGGAGTETNPGNGQPNGEGQGQGNGQGGGNGGNNDGGGHETRDDVGTQYELTQIEREALQKMEALGPEWHNRALVMRGLMERGRSAAIASAVIGNACVEAAGCELRFSIEQFGGGPGRGIIQWTYGDRFGTPGQENSEDTLLGYAARRGLNWTDPAAQIGFIDWELRHNYGAVGVALRDANSVAQATEIFLRQYERPADPEASIGKRTSFAIGTFNMYQELLDNVQESNDFDFNYRDRTFVESYLNEKYGEVSGQLGKADLVTLGGSFGSSRLFKDAAFSLRAMSAAMEAEIGRPLQLSGGPGSADAYRDYATQVRLHNEKPDLAAEPGTSKHGWGLAADFNLDEKAHAWLSAHAREYGWGQYEWAQPGGSKPEPWHWEYMRGVNGIQGVKLTDTFVPGQPNEQGNQGGNEQGNGNGHENGNQDEPKVLVSKAGFALPLAANLFHTLSTRYLGYSNPAVMGNHHGWDFDVPVGTPVNPVRRGVVYSVTPEAESGGAGYTLEIRHDDGTYSDYEHLSEVDVKVGDQVTFGDVIAKSGNSGRSSGAHLHVTLHEKGVPEYASHSDSLEEIDRKTINPADVMPSPEAVQDWLNRHGSARIMGQVALGTVNQSLEMSTEDSSETLSAGHSYGNYGADDDSDNQPNDDNHGQGVGNANGHDDNPGNVDDPDTTTSVDPEQPSESDLPEQPQIIEPSAISGPVV